MVLIGKKLQLRESDKLIIIVYRLLTHFELIAYSFPPCRISYV